VEGNSAAARSLVESCCVLKVYCCQESVVPFTKGFTVAKGLLCVKVFTKPLLSGCRPILWADLKPFRATASLLDCWPFTFGSRLLFFSLQIDHIGLEQGFVSRIFSAWGFFVVFV
jgi:hypothetical protein